MATGSELKERFLEAFSDTVLRYLAQHIHDSYPDSIERAASMDWEFARRAIPQIRHYVIQSRVRYLAKHFPHITTEIDRSDGNEPYTILRSENFYLTVSMAKEPGQLPRKSDFRKDNALDNLFERFDPDKVDYYAILTHVPASDNSAPIHLAVLFPDDTYTGVYEWIDLTPLIDFELEPSTATPSEDIDVPEPTLRKRLPKKKEAS